MVAVATVNTVWQAGASAEVKRHAPVPAEVHHRKVGHDRPQKAAGAERLPIGIEQALFLIRSTLLTLNDADRSGNYTVLRDLAAPGVQARYNAADLAQIFSTLRTSHIDLSVVALAAPKLSRPPKLLGEGQLQLTGVFATHPREIHFDLLFQIVDGHWKWLGIAVTAPDAPATATARGGR